MGNCYQEICPDPGGKIPAVDYLKGFSIFTIACMHLLEMMSAVPSKIMTLAAIGGTGVHVFFLCSGIGLYTSYLKRKTSFCEFLKKRFLKIYIPYILVVLVSFFAPYLYSGEDKLTALLSHVFLFKMFVPRYEESFGTHFWFISTLFQLYALFIPMCLLKEKLSGRKLFLSVFVGISVVWWILCDRLGVSEVRVWSSFCLQYIWEFAIGFVLAELFYEQKRYRLHNGLLLACAVLGIGLQAFMALYSDALKVFNDIPALIGYGSLALFLRSIPFVRYVCHKLSSFSYEYYLVHILVFASVFYLLKPQGLPMQCAVGCAAMAIALLTAFLYHIAVNRRSLRKAKAGRNP